jgi:hypothetical protein
MNGVSKAVIVASFAAVVIGTAEPSSAQGTGSIPTGALMMFDAAACPAGWSAFNQAKGRAIFGLPDNVPNLRVIGAPLSSTNQSPTHTHIAGHSLRATTSPAGDHQHTVDPVAFTTSTQRTGTPGEGTGPGLNKSAHMTHVHNVTIDVPATNTTQAGAHVHPVSLTGAVTNAPSPLGAVVPYIQVLICRKD